MENNEYSVTELIAECANDESWGESFEQRMQLLYGMLYMITM